MFRRAKSFIHRSKKDETTQNDLSETAHLRRNVVIDSKVLEQQKTRSNEHLNNQVIEQLKRFNFGTASEALPKLRRSKSNVKRRSFVQEDSNRFTHHRASGDVISQFGPQAKTSENQTTFIRQISASQEHLHDQVKDQIRKRNHDGDGKAEKPSEAMPKLHSEAKPSVDIYENPRAALDSLLEKIRSERSRSASSERPSDPPLFKNNDDFLLNRKSIDLGLNSRQRRKPDVVPPKHGLKTFFHKLSGSQKSFNGSQKSCDGASSTSSSACSSFERTHPAYRSERGIAPPMTSETELSRKRQHKGGFVRNAPAYSSERRWRGEKIDRLGRDKEKT